MLRTEVELCKYEGENQIHIISKPSNNDTSNVIRSLVPGEVEIVFLYTSFSYLIASVGSDQYLWFTLEDRVMRLFITHISPLPNERDVLLPFEIFAVKSLTENNENKSKLLVKSANIYERDIGNNIKTFTIRGKLNPQNNNQEIYLVVPSQQFHISAPYGSSGKKVLMFLSRATQVKYIFSFNDNNIALSFANHLKNFAAGQAFTPHNSS